MTTKFKYLKNWKKFRKTNQYFKKHFPDYEMFKINSKKPLKAIYLKWSYE